MSHNAATVETSNDLFNEVLCRSMADLYMLMTETPQGPYPYAGIPWYSTTFGRDGLITALQMLWLDPRIAQGVLRRLAALQATTDDPASDARARKDPARDARRRDGGAARGAVRPLLRQRRCHAAVRDAGRPLCRAHRRRCHHRGVVARHRGRARLDRRPRRSRRRRLRRILPRHRGGSRQPGLEGFARRDLPRRRHAGRRPDRAGGGAGLRLLPPSAWRRVAPSGLAACRMRTALEAEARSPGRALRRRVLVPGARHLRARARRREAAVPRAQLQCRAGAVHRHRQAGAGARGRRRTAAAAISFPAGASAPSPIPKRATTRCPITTARSGRTTTR